MLNATLQSKQDTLVYFYFKQDYGYRGLEGDYEGTISLQELEDLLDEFKNTNSNNKLKEFIEKNYPTQPLMRHSFEEAFGLEHNLVEQLIQDKLVGAYDEIGYEGFSLISAKHAKDKVKEMFMDVEF